MSISQELVMLSVFGGVAIAAYALLALVDPYWLRVRSRVTQLQHGSAGPAAQLTASAARGAKPSSRFDFLGVLSVFGPAGRSRLIQRLTKAGLYKEAAVSRFFSAKLAMMTAPPLIAVALGFGGYLRMDRALLAGCLAGGLGSLLPGLWLDRAIARRHLLLHKSLPDFLDLMIVCLEGGMSLQETIRRVSDELRFVHPALAYELGIVQRDIELGATVDQALKRFAVRTDYEGVRTLSTFIRESQRFGTNITEALRTHSDMLRSQREQAAEERAQKASVKILIPTLLLIFPAIFIVMVGPAAIQIHEAFSTK